MGFRAGKPRRIDNRPKTVGDPQRLKFHPLAGLRPVCDDADRPERRRPDGGFGPGHEPDRPVVDRRAERASQGEGVDIRPAVLGGHAGKPRAEVADRIVMIRRARQRRPQSRRLAERGFADRLERLLVHRVSVLCVLTQCSVEIEENRVERCHTT